MCVVAPGQDDAPNDESFVGDAPVDEGNEGVGDSNVVGNGTVLILKKKTFFPGAHKYKADKVHQDDPATDGGADGDWEDVTPPVGDSNEQPPEEPQEQTQGQTQDQAQDTQQDQSQNQLTTEPGTIEEPDHIDSFDINSLGNTGKKYEAEKEFKEEHFESKNSQMKMCKTCEFLIISLFLPVL